MNAAARAAVLGARRTRRPPINHTAPEIPLSDMGGSYTYHGYEGGLYPGRQNIAPAAHVAAGLAAAALVEPLDTNGDPDPTNGKIVVTTIGMSNLEQECCASANSGWVSDPSLCPAQTIVGRWFANVGVTINPKVTLIKGNRGGPIGPLWLDVNNAEWGLIVDNVLTPQGLTEAQIQWCLLKNVRADPAITSTPLSGGDPDAFKVRDNLKTIIANAKFHYPNLRGVSVTSRMYADYNTGHANHSRHPEPYAYEIGFAVKWLVEDYILGKMPASPWVDWGPYPWAKGTTPRSDGLTWVSGDMEADGVHPSTQGENKHGGIWHDWMNASPYFEPWWLI